MQNSHEDLSHRILNALEPGTDIPIHRHPTKDESFVILRGKVRSTTYNDDGSMIESVVLSLVEGRYGVDIPKGVWHKLESLESGSVVFECKEGVEIVQRECLSASRPVCAARGAFALHEGGWDFRTSKEMKKYLKALWQFCSYVFVSQRRPKEN